MHKKIEPLLNSMFEALKNKYNELPIGLLSGKSGMLILFSYLNNLFPDKYNDIFENMTDGLFYSVQNENNNFSMSSGISGAAYTIQTLQILAGFDSETDALEEIDKHIAKSIDLEIKLNNWDPLHGYIGQGIYLLQRHQYVNQKLGLTKVINALYDSRVKNDSYKLWVTSGLTGLSGDNYNFGMAHGMSGIVSFLSLVAQQNIEKNKCKEMITSCMDYIYSYQRNEGENYLFPQSIELEKLEDNGGGRLAWCYGDLCVANAFFHAAKTFDNKEWYDRGLIIALNTTKLSYDKSRIIDPMICHGLSGVILQHYRYYKLTGKLEFKKAFNNHLEILLDQFYKKKSGIGGFQNIMNFNGEYIEKNEAGILEGSAGIAMVLLTLLYDLEDWDLFLMTNV